MLWAAHCRYAKEPYIEMSPTAPSDLLSPPPGAEALSMDVRSASFGGRTMDFKIQFVPPCFIRYYIPSPMVPARLMLSRMNADLECYMLAIHWPTSGSCHAILVAQFLVD